MYESKYDPPMPGINFTRRLLLHALGAVLLLIRSLGIGVFGYCYFEGLSVPDAFHNSAILLGGRGVRISPTTTSGKLFAGVYSLYSNLIFIATLSLIVAPIAHRILHKFHWGSKS